MVLASSEWTIRNVKCGRTYPGTAVSSLVGFDPYDVFTSPISPLREHLSPPFKAFASTAAYPEEYKTRFGCQQRNW